MTKTRASEELLGKLHLVLTQELLKRIESGEATAPEIAAAIKLLKDNGIEAVRDPGSPMDKLAQKVLPVFDDEDVTTEYAN